MADPSPTSGISAEEFVHGDYPRSSWLVDGEVIVTEPTLWHQVLASRIESVLRHWNDGDPPRGLAGHGGNWVLGGSNVYAPDAWWIARGRLLDVHVLYVETPPDLVVEVRSPSTWLYDLGRKRQMYQERGVKELWLVDHPAEVVLVLRRLSPESAEFDDWREVGRGQILTSPLLSEFALSIDELFTPPRL